MRRSPWRCRGSIQRRPRGGAGGAGGEIGVTADGTKAWVAISDGLRDLKVRGLQADPRLAVGDGTLGFWGVLDQVYPKTVPQRCWFHKMWQCTQCLAQALHGKAQADLQAIWMAPTNKQATHAFQGFINCYAAKYPKATEKLEK